MSWPYLSPSSGPVDPRHLFIGHARETRLSFHLLIPFPPCSWVALGCSKKQKPPRDACLLSLSIWKDTPCSVRTWRLKGGMWGLCQIESSLWAGLRQDRRTGHIVHVLSILPHLCHDLLTNHQGPFPYGSCLPLWSPSQSLFLPGLSFLNLLLAS